MTNKYINGFRIFAPKSREELLSYIDSYKGILVALNAEKILKKDPELKKLINRNIGYPDGVGAVWALKNKGVKTLKIPGVEFWIDIIEEFHNKKSVYLIGASQEVVQKTVNLLKKEYPRINIKNYRNGFLSKENDIENLKIDLAKKKPDVVFVAMGTPKQEFIMDELFKSHPALYMGLGGSFDVYSGRKKRAPKLYQKLSLEWFYRLLKEPTRIKRQLVLWKFFFLISFRKI